MGARRDTLTLIRTSFAGRDQLIERAFREDEWFRGLCLDYFKCAAAVDHWQQVQAPVAALRRQEYSHLLKELRGEIEAWLGAMKTGQPRSNERSR